MGKVLVVINEQHSLMPDQERILSERFGSFDFMKVPSAGWTLAEQVDIAGGFEGSEVDHVVFASPVPVLLAKCAAFSAHASLADAANTGRVIEYPAVWVLHNDHRDKKELPNGKVISVVAQEGWELVRV